MNFKVKYNITEELQRKLIVEHDKKVQLQPTKEIKISKEWEPFLRFEVDGTPLTLDLTTPLKNEINRGIWTRHQNETVVGDHIQYRGRRRGVPLFLSLSKTSTNTLDIKKRFDHLPTEEELLELAKEHAFSEKDPLRYSKEYLKRHYEQHGETILENIDAAKQKIDAIIEEETAKANENAKRERKEKEELDKRRAEKRAKEKEKKDWIEQYGSERLKEGYELGYDMQKVYVLERAEKELPGYWVDFYDKIAYLNERTNPTKTSIDKTKKLLEKGFDASIRWAEDKDVPQELFEKLDLPYNFPKEVVCVKRFLGKYWLFNKEDLFE